jgi:hypothetical protein
MVTLPSGTTVQPDTLRQCGSCQRLPNGIPGGVSNLQQPIQKPKCLQHGRVDADTHPWITRLDALQSRSRRKGPLGNDRHGQPAAAACVVNIGA